MENKGLISVIIPVYNVESYLRECVDSVLNQTYKNFEIILVDDGSTDSSGKICDEYARKSDKVKVTHKKNGGLSSARNCGFSEASGEYVYFLDSDDYISEEALEKFLNTAVKDESDFVFFDAFSFFDGKKEVLPNQNYLRDTCYEPAKGTDILLSLQKNKDFHSAVPLLFFKKSFICENRLSFVDGIVFEDMIYTFQAFCKAEKVSHLNEALYYRRYRKGSIMTSSKNLRHFSSSVRVFCEVLDFSERNVLMSYKAVNDYIIRCAYNVFNIYEKLPSSDKSDAKAELKKAKDLILSKDAFKNKALKMRCYGKVFWFARKVIEKISG